MTNIVLMCFIVFDCVCVFRKPHASQFYTYPFYFGISRLFRFDYWDPGPCNMRHFAPQREHRCFQHHWEAPVRGAACPATDQYRELRTSQNYTWKKHQCSSTIFNPSHRQDAEVGLSCHFSVLRHHREPQSETCSRSLVVCVKLSGHSLLSGVFARFLLA